MTKVLVTGSRDFSHVETLEAALELSAPTVVIHGAARGADTLAAAWCRKNPKVYEIAVPAKWDLLGKSAGMARNRVMASLSPDLVLAFFATGAANVGTTAMTKLARQRGIRVEAFWA